MDFRPHKSLLMTENPSITTSGLLSNVYYVLSHGNADPEREAVKAVRLVKDYFIQSGGLENTSA